MSTVVEMPPHRSPTKTIIDIAATPNSSPLKTSASDGSSTAAPGSTAPLLKPSRLSNSGNSNSGTSDTIPPPAFDIEEAAPSSSLLSKSSSAASPEKLSWSQKHLIRPLRNKVVTPMIDILKSGATAEGIALSLAFGLAGGLFPVPMTTTVICLLFVFVFKLNVATVQLVNLLMTPVNLATFLTFIRYGETLFGAPPVELSLEPFKEDVVGALATFWISLCYGIAAWALLTPPLVFVAYQLLKPIMRKAMAAMFAKPD